MPEITLWFLQASRSVRTAWLLEELGIDYKIKFSERENGVAPPAFKKAAGGLGKFPTLQVDDVMIYESGNIAQYLCDVFDKEHRFLPPVGDRKRYEHLQWIHMSEGTFAVHAMSILYNRWHQKDGDVALTEQGMSKEVLRDLTYLEETLQKSSGKFLFGDHITAADTMMHFSACFIMLRKLGVKNQGFPRITQYVKDCEETETYKRAVEKTGHRL